MLGIDIDTDTEPRPLESGSVELRRDIFALGAGRLLGRARLFAYDLSSGMSEQIAEFAASDSEGAKVIGVGPTGILLESSSYPAGIDIDPLAILTARITQSYELLSFDGTRRTQSQSRDRERATLIRGFRRFL